MLKTKLVLLLFVTTILIAGGCAKKTESKKGPSSTSASKAAPYSCKPNFETEPSGVIPAEAVMNLKHTYRLVAVDIYEELEKYSFDDSKPDGQKIVPLARAGYLQHVQINSLRGENLEDLREGDNIVSCVDFHELPKATLSGMPHVPVFIKPGGKLEKLANIDIEKFGPQAGYSDRTKTTFAETDKEMATIQAILDDLKGKNARYVFKMQDEDLHTFLSFGSVTTEVILKMQVHAVYRRAPTEVTP